MLLACSLLAAPREASAVVILNPDPVIEHLYVTDFLDLSYSLLLGRAPDPTGTATFRAFLTGGGDTNTVATAIDSSAEYYSRVVTSYYQKFLSRSPTALELTQWVGLLTTPSGVTDEALIAALVGSAEYQAVWHVNTPEQLIDRMFHDLLGRSANPTENMLWQKVLSSSNAMTVAQDIENSSEYRNRLITHLFQYDLDRLPSPTDVSDFLGFLTGGATDEQLITLLVGSGEFLADAEQLGGSSDSFRVLEFRRQPTSVPEPPALSLMAIGMICLARLCRIRAPADERGSHAPRLAIGG
jgi:hypothetical protein